MTRTMTELHTFTGEDLIAMAKAWAKIDIIEGRIERQDFEWTSDGTCGLKIMTTYSLEKE